MSAAKKSKEKEKPKDVEEIAIEEPLEEVAVPELDVPELAEAVPAANGVPVKKPLGVKEVIPFKWKLVGTVNHTTLTLFKAVEREDVEAQLERVGKEGYYTDLRILEKDAKVIQPKQPPKPPEPKAAKPTKAAAPAPKATKEKPKPASAAKPLPKKVVVAAKAKTPAKPKKVEKPAKKAAKKK